MSYALLVIEFNVCILARGNGFRQTVRKVEDI